MYRASFLVVLLSATLICTDASAATYTYSHFADSSLIGLAPGPDAIWGTGDDIDLRTLPSPDDRPNYNPTGSASYQYVDASDGSPLDIGVYTYSFTVDSTTLQFTTFSSTLVVAGYSSLLQNGSFELDPGFSSEITVDPNDGRHHSHNLFLHNSTNPSQIYALASDGYSLFNVSGLDNPDGSWDAFFSDNLLFARNLANQQGLAWREISVEFFDQGSDLFGNHYGIVAFDISLVPVPAAIWLLGSALLGMVGVTRRRAHR